MFEVQSVLHAIGLLVPLGRHLFPSNSYCCYKFKLQLLGLQQTLNKSLNNSQFNRQKLLIIYPYNQLVLAHLLGRLFVIFGG
jgi:hypothetical protein